MPLMPNQIAENLNMWWAWILKLKVSPVKLWSNEGFTEFKGVNEPTFFYCSRLLLRRWLGFRLASLHQNENKKLQYSLEWKMAFNPRGETWDWAPLRRDWKKSQIRELSPLAFNTCKRRSLGWHCHHKDGTYFNESDKKCFNTQNCKNDEVSTTGWVAELLESAACWVASFVSTLISSRPGIEESCKQNLFILGIIQENQKSSTANPSLHRALPNEQILSIN